MGSRIDVRGFYESQKWCIWLLWVAKIAAHGFHGCTWNPCETNLNFPCFALQFNEGCVAPLEQFLCGQCKTCCSRILCAARPFVAQGFYVQQDLLLKGSECSKTGCWQILWAIRWIVQGIYAQQVFIDKFGSLTQRRLPSLSKKFNKTKITEKVTLKNRSIF